MVWGAHTIFIGFGLEYIGMIQEVRLLTLLPLSYTAVFDFAIRLKSLASLFKIQSNSNNLYNNLEIVFNIGY